LAAYVRFWHKADVPEPSINVCFRGKSGHATDIAEFPLMTQSGHAPDGIAQCNPRVLTIALTLAKSAIVKAAATIRYSVAMAPESLFKNIKDFCIRIIT
jgi:hypothetical protein